MRMYRNLSKNLYVNLRRSSKICLKNNSQRYQEIERKKSHHSIINIVLLFLCSNKIEKHFFNKLVFYACCEKGVRGTTYLFFHFSSWVLKLGKKVE